VRKKTQRHIKVFTRKFKTSKTIDKKNRAQKIGETRAQEKQQVREKERKEV